MGSQDAVPTGSRPTRHSADRLTALALVVSIGVAALLGLWLFPRATDWLPTSLRGECPPRPRGAIHFQVRSAGPADAGTGAYVRAAGSDRGEVSCAGRARVLGGLARPGAVLRVAGERARLRPGGGPAHRRRPGAGARSAESARRRTLVPGGARPVAARAGSPAGVVVPWTAPAGPTAAQTALPARAGVSATAATGAARRASPPGAMGSESVVRDPEGKGVQLHAAPDPQSARASSCRTGRRCPSCGSRWGRRVTRGHRWWSGRDRAPVRALAPSTRCGQAAATAETLPPARNRTDDRSFV